jgi:uncharacterized protein YqgV (UPF0045/DUF77 family)
MIVEIECLPNPPGTATDRYAHVEAAIAVVQRSGLRFVVNALGTTVEGTPDQLWPLLRDVHEGCLTAGAASLVSLIKVAQSAGDDPTIDGLTGKFRNEAAGP